MKYVNFKHFRSLTSKQESITFLNLSMQIKKKKNSIQSTKKKKVKKKDYKK